MPTMLESPGSDLTRSTMVSMALLLSYHARRALPAFSLRSEQLSPLPELVGLTCGMPLALILAAGWVKVPDLGQIAAVTLPLLTCSG